MHERSEFRGDIQGLRAIAVISVVIFHIWPSALPGGFVGVDVFFVISGYLITRLLLREAETNGSISLLRFYERRVRRLLPAATLVLIAVALAIPLLPQARWEDTATEIAASALYVENWRLAWLSVDYLGSENAPSPVQHYWSLSIEEQFYVIWPLLLMAVLAIGRPRGLPLRQSLLFCLATVTAASFVASVMISHQEPARAYFVTHTRIWELGLGGLLSLARMPAIPDRLAELLRVGGLAAILVACMTFSAETIFPGYAALLPTLGCAAVIMAGARSTPVSALRLLEARTMQYVGAISYSAYLWHWPLIVFASAYLQGPIGAAVGGLVAVATWLLADLTKRHIEDRFRRPSAAGTPIRVVGAGALSTIICMGAAAAIYATAHLPAPGIAAADVDHYPGPAALLHNVSVPDVDVFMPVDPTPWRDLPEAYRGERCHLNFETVDLTPCIIGHPEAATTVFLVGDSHAAHWIPAFESIADERGWYVETHTKSSCPVLVEAVRRRGHAYDECREWGGRVLDHISRTRPDMVVVAMSGNGQLHDQDRDIADAARKTLAQILESGATVVAIADTPWHQINPAECIEADPACASPRLEALRRDTISIAAAAEAQVHLIDMNDALCTEDICPVVIGNVVAWRDKHHLTATYSRMLGPILAERLPALAARAVLEIN